MAQQKHDILDLVFEVLSEWIWAIIVAVAILTAFTFGGHVLSLIAFVYSVVSALLNFVEAHKLLTVAIAFFFIFMLREHVLQRKDAYL